MRRISKARLNAYCNGDRDLSTRGQRRRAVRFPHGERFVLSRPYSAARAPQAGLDRRATNVGWLRRMSATRYPDSTLHAAEDGATLQARAAASLAPTPTRCGPHRNRGPARLVGAFRSARASTTRRERLSDQFPCIRSTLRCSLARGPCGCRSSPISQSLRLHHGSNRRNGRWSIPHRF